MQSFKLSNDPQFAEKLPEIVGLYLLTYIDVPWEDDPQREHPDKREYFWEIFNREVENTGVPFVVIKGERAERRAAAVKAIENLLSSSEHKV